MTARTRFALASFLLAVVAGLYVVLAPLMTRCSFSSVDGAHPCTELSLYETEGTRILVVIAIPIVAALVPVVVGRRWVAVGSAVLLWICCVVAAASIGWFFVPAAVAMTIAATRRNPVPATSVA